LFKNIAEVQLILVVPLISLAEIKTVSPKKKHE